jgi:hypothetical protein
MTYIEKLEEVLNEDFLKLLVYNCKKTGREQRLYEEINYNNAVLFISRLVGIFETDNSDYWYDAHLSVHSLNVMGDLGIEEPKNIFK